MDVVSKVIFVRIILSRLQVRLIVTVTSQLFLDSEVHLKALAQLG